MFFLQCLRGAGGDWLRFDYRVGPAPHHAYHADCATQKNHKDLSARIKPGLMLTRCGQQPEQPQAQRHRSLSLLVTVYGGHLIMHMIITLMQMSLARPALR